MKMDRKELRDARHGKGTAAGSVERELGELHKLQESNRMNGIETITATCSEYFTIICC